MAKSLEISGAINENLKKVKDSDGTDTSLSLSDRDILVAGDIEVSGTYKGRMDIDGAIKSNNDIMLDSTGDIHLDAAGSDINFRIGSADNYLNWNSVSGLTIKNVSDIDDYFRIKVDSNAVTTISTTQDAGSNHGDLRFDVDGDISLDSGNGVFVAKRAGTEFSAANSAYAGMILGCTHVFGSGTGGQYQSVTTAWESLLWDTDKYALVTFKVPPSNRVKISVHLPWIAASGYQVRLGLATDSSATTLNTKYENDIDDANRADSFNINYSWVVEGSDHSWSAGETKTLYIMAYTGGATRFYTGGTNTSAYGGVIVEATALPATIGDGSE